MEVRFHRLAMPEYVEARTWYELRGPALAQEFIAETDRAVERIAKAPDRRPLCFKHYRRVRLQRFPYTLYYRVVDPSLILVLAMAHARRRPGYWRRRSSLN
jgi:plasmid stabilization system protein ParE